jgi:DNA polymerase-1
LTSQKVIGFKVFADYKNAVNSTVYGVAFGYNKDLDVENPELELNSSTETFYLPLGAKLSSQLSFEEIKYDLVVLFQNEEVKKFTHDVKGEICILKTLGIELKGVIFDTMLACYIKDSNANSNFDIQCMEQIDHILPTIVSGAKKTSFAESDISVVENYTGDVISSLFNLTLYWWKSLDKKEYAILSDIEIPLAYVLAGMEITGVSIDRTYLKTLTSEFNSKLLGIEQKVYDIAGEVFNINSPKQVATILFDKLQLKSSKKRGKSKKSTGAEVLMSLAEEFEIAQLILDYRKYAKLKSTYTEALPELIDFDERIHTSYNQTVTTTGRLSSSAPNLQNIPVRTEEGNKIRKAFVPKDKENYLIMSADYSQIELRLLAHVSKDENLIAAFKSGIDVHTLTASKVFDVPVEEVTKEMRYKAKAVNFGIVYGQSRYGLAKALKIKPDEAQQFIDKYFETYPSIREYMADMVALVETQGYVETILGRKRYLESEINSPNGMIREFAKRAAINHPMQGSASDLIKLAMIDFYNKLKAEGLKSKLIMQVHDELVVEVAKDELEHVKDLVLKSMELEQPLLVPLLVDVNTGDSWKES